MLFSSGVELLDGFGPDPVDGVAVALTELAASFCFSFGIEDTAVGAGITGEDADLLGGFDGAFFGVVRVSNGFKHSGNNPAIII